MSPAKSDIPQAAQPALAPPGLACGQGAVMAGPGKAQAEKWNVTVTFTVTREHIAAHWSDGEYKTREVTEEDVIGAMECGGPLDPDLVDLNSFPYVIGDVNEARGK